MKVILYLNSAENERVDKTSFLQKVQEVEGALRDPSSLLNPVITFQLPTKTPQALIDEDDEEIESADGDIVIEGDDIIQFNYAYIPEFKRYYFITDIVAHRTGLFIVSMIPDVLMSFKDYLADLVGFIERNEFTYDDALNDSLRPTKEIPEVTIEDAERGNITFTADAEDLDYNFVANMLVCNMNFKGTPIDKPFAIGHQIDPETFQGGNAIPYIIKRNNLTSVLYRAVKGQGQDIVSDYICSVIAFPFNIPRKADASLQVIHYLDSSKNLQSSLGADMYGYIPRANTSDYLVLGYYDVPEATSYLDLPPFKKTEIFLPFYGWHELDVQKVQGHRLAIYYIANYQDGSAMVIIYDINKASMIFSSSCQLGVSIPVTTTNQKEIETKKNALNLNLAVGLITGALSIGAGVVTGSAVSYAIGGSQISNTIAQYVNQNMQLFQRAQVTFAGGAFGVYNPLKIQIRTTRFQTTIHDEPAYAKIAGKPLMKTYPLYLLSGFTIVSAIHLEEIPAFKSEKDEIERLLKMGVIL